MNSPDFETLPHEIQLEILCRADFKSVGQVSQVASKFRGLGRNELLWRNKFKQIYKGLDPENIPLYLAIGWLETFQLMHSLLNPKRCFTFIIPKSFDPKIHRTLGANITIVRNFVAKNKYEAIDCIDDAYNKKAEPLFSMMIARKFMNIKEFQSLYIRTSPFESPYFDLNSRLVNDPYTGLTLFKFIYIYESDAEYFSIPEEAVLTIPGNDSSIIYGLIALLLNYSEFFLVALDKVVSIQPLLEFLRKKTAFMKFKRNYRRNYFIGPDMENIFETLRQRCEDTYVIVEGPLRQCPLKNTCVYEQV